MDTSTLINWSVYLIVGCAVFSFLGMIVDIISITSEKKKIRPGFMLLNYVNIVIDVVIRFMAIPLILVVISWVDVIIPAGSMNRPEGFFSFIAKLVAIIAIIVVSTMIKIPHMGKKNEVDRVNTRTGAILGAIIGTGYFGYVNFIDIKRMFFTYMKMFGL